MLHSIFPRTVRAWTWTLLLRIVYFPEFLVLLCRWFIRFFLVLFALGPGHYCCERRTWQLFVQCLGLLGKMRRITQNGEVCAAVASVAYFAQCCSHLEFDLCFEELIVPGSHLCECSGNEILTAHMLWIFTR